MNELNKIEAAKVRELKAKVKEMIVAFNDAPSEIEKYAETFVDMEKTLQKHLDCKAFSAENMPPPPDQNAIASRRPKIRGTWHDLKIHK